jgi:tRNA(fMet)-specific endonuclease VapC
MPLVKVKNNYQITIPESLRKKFKIALGDSLEPIDQVVEVRVGRLNFENLLDTDTCINILRSRPNVLAKADNLVPAKVYIAAITVGELMYGAYNMYKRYGTKRHLCDVRAFLASTELVALDDVAADKYGELKCSLALAGNLIEDNDLQIGCIAITQNYILVTSNIEQFERLKQDGLQFESWRTS